MPTTAAINPDAASTSGMDPETTAEPCVRCDLVIAVSERDRDAETDLAVYGHLIPGTVVSGLLGGWRIANPGAVIVLARRDPAAALRRFWLRLIPGATAEPITTLAARLS